ncbi:MAG TPA: PspC domain-containing protein [Actinomycetota bacterium]|nr:PspC domain-containing protein [Actinomycetota bacterium]
MSVLRRQADHLAFSRSSGNRVVAGVAAGLGQRLGVDPVFVRASFVLMTLAAGLGVVSYVVAWALAGPAPAGDPGAVGAGTGVPSQRKGAALVLFVLGALLLFREIGLWAGDAVGLPVVLVSVGWAVVYARSDDSERTKLSRMLVGVWLPRVDAGTSLLRLGAGGALVAVGLGSLVSGIDRVTNVRTPLAWVAVALGGLTVLFGPLVARLVRDLAEERRERIRSEERSELAAHLHDSVLQTLALIQRNAGSPRRMASLARTQERELRAWLYGQGAARHDTLRSAMESVADAVERDHEVAVDAVVVGDASLDERTQALVHACREAISNAARHSGAEEVSAYVEVDDSAITAYVRDRGRGFDPASVPDDRRGITDSIRGRIERHGGAAGITSSPGAGTEVQMRMPRSPA